MRTNTHHHRRDVIADLRKTIEHTERALEIAEAAEIEAAA